MVPSSPHRSPRPFRVYAHRGACAELPENTLPAFARALELGCDALETDVHVTRDGHVVVHHDATGLRTAGEGRPVAAVSLAEIRRWDAGRALVLRGQPQVGRGFVVPTLEELLDAFRDAPINVDIKAPGPAAVARVIGVVRDHGATDRVTLTSVSDATCRAIARAGYPGPIGLGRDQALVAVFAPLAMARRLRGAGSALQIPWRYRGLRFDRPRVVARAHALDLRVDYWTVDDPARARAIAALGADGLMTDDPAAVVPALRDPV